MAASAKRLEHDCYVQGLGRPTAALRRPQGPSTLRMLTCPQASYARNSMAECRTFLLAVGLRAELRLADKWKVPGRAKPYCVTNLRCHSGAQPNRLGRFSCEPGIHNPRRLRQPRRPRPLSYQVHGLWSWVPGSAPGASARTARSADPSGRGPGMTTHRIL
jgi:hypothetical protein